MDLQEKIFYNEKKLASLKLKKINLETEIRRVENKLLNQRQALKAQKKPEE